MAMWRTWDGGNNFSDLRVALSSAICNEEPFIPVACTISLSTPVDSIHVVTGIRRRATYFSRCVQTKHQYPHILIFVEERAQSVEQRRKGKTHEDSRQRATREMRVGNGGGGGRRDVSNFESKLTRGVACDLRSC
jgi:hypothetical protein